MNNARKKLRMEVLSVRSFWYCFVCGTYPTSMVERPGI